MDALNQLLATFKVQANIFHNGQYCGNWAVDTSGSNYISFHIITHGECFLSLTQSSSHVEQLRAGDIVMLPRDNRHCITNDVSFSQPINSAKSKNYQQGIEQTSTGLICGYFSHQHPIVNKVAQQLPEYIIIRKTDNQQSLSLLMQALIIESLADSQDSTYVLNRIAEAALAMVFRHHLPQNKGLLAAAIHPKLSVVLQAVHQAPEKKWSVEQMASLCYVSRASFAELFKDVLGQSPMEYLTEWRLSIAYRLLADEKASTLQAALTVGYDNESSFSKAFKRVLGVTPGAVRTQANSNESLV